MLGDWTKRNFSIKTYTLEGMGARREGRLSETLLEDKEGGRGQSTGLTRPVAQWLC